MTNSEKPNQVDTPGNAERSLARIWTATAVVGALGFASSMLPELPDRASNALLALGSVLAIVSLFAAAGCRSRALLADRIKAGDGLIAHWSYSNDLWNRFMRKRFEFLSNDWRFGFIITAVVGTVCGGLLIAAGAPVVSVASIALGAILCAGLLWKIVPLIQLRRFRRNPPEVFIAEDGLLLAGKLFAWSGTGRRLEDLKLQADEEQNLVFWYSRHVRAFRQWLKVEVPIPPGMLQKAQEVLDAFVEVRP
jgi:hypothetical protein